MMKFTVLALSVTAQTIETTGSQTASSPDFLSAGRSLAFYDGWFDYVQEHAVEPLKEGVQEHIVDPFKEGVQEHIVDPLTEKGTKALNTVTDGVKQIVPKQFHSVVDKFENEAAQVALREGTEAITPLKEKVTSSLPAWMKSVLATSTATDVTTATPSTDTTAAVTTAAQIGDSKATAAVTTATPSADTTVVTTLAAQIGDVTETPELIASSAQASI